MSFVARYGGTCQECGEPIVAGELIRHSLGFGYEHERCPEPSPGPPVCERCWLTKPCECDS